MTIPRYDAHLCLVSQQATPNFVPALDGRFRPREIVLAISDDMAERAGWLEAGFRSLGIKTTRLRIRDAWDVPSIQEDLLQFMAEDEQKNIALNVTGGTKPMAIAAQQVFGAADKPIFYVHPQRNEVMPLFSSDPAFQIQERVTLKDYLGIHGYTITRQDKREFDERWYLLAEEWVKDVELFADPLRQLNYVAQQAEKSLKAPLPDHRKYPKVWAMIDKLDQYGIASAATSNLVFPSETARFFANGGWLELHVARAIERLAARHGAQGVARSLRVESAGHARNEIDVAALVHNRLYLIECKTRGMRSESDAAGPGAETLYKLDSLTALGGLNTRGMLASYQPLETWDKQRARDLGINIIEGGQLRNLDEHLTKWVT